MDQDTLEKVKAAKKQIVDGSLTIWNARLEAYAKTGDLTSALAELKNPIEVADNSGCNQNCASDVLSALGEQLLKYKRQQ